MVLKLSVSLKDESGEKSYKQEWNIYDPLSVNTDTEADLKPFIEEAMKNFNEKCDTVRVRMAKEM